MDQEFVGYLFLTVLAVVVVLLILREIICWYYKINERISLQKQILVELKRMNGGPSPIVTADPVSRGATERGELPFSSSVRYAYKEWVNNPSDAAFVDFISALDAESQRLPARVTKAKMREAFPEAAGHSEFDVITARAGN